MQAPASPQCSHVTSGLWDPVDLHTERVREDSPLIVLCRKTLHLSPLLSPCLCCIDADGSTNNVPSLPPLHPYRPLLLTHQRQFTAYSLPAATMETGVVVYDSERPVCRKIERKRGTQWQGKRDKEQDLLTKSMYQITCGWNKISLF